MAAAVAGPVRPSPTSCHTIRLNLQKKSYTLSEDCGYADPQHEQLLLVQGVASGWGEDSTVTIAAELPSP